MDLKNILSYVQRLFKRGDFRAGQLGDWDWDFNSSSFFQLTWHFPRDFYLDDFRGFIYLSGGYFYSLLSYVRGGKQFK